MAGGSRGWGGSLPPRTVLARLVEFHSSEPAKQQEVCVKLARLEVALGRLERGVEVLQGVREEEGVGEEGRRELGLELVQILASQTGLTEQQNMMFLQVGFCCSCSQGPKYVVSLALVHYIRSVPANTTF